MATLTIGKYVYVTVPEVARRKRVTRQCVWAAIERKALPARRYGRFWVVPILAMQAWHPEVRARAAVAT